MGLSVRMSCWLLGIWVAAGASISVPAHAQDSDLLAARSAKSADDIWQKSVKKVSEGQFEVANDLLKRLEVSGGLAKSVKQWLEEYEEMQSERTRLDREEFDRYVGFAKERIERKEWGHALDWTLAAQDTAQDQQAFLTTPWVKQLIADAKAHAHKQTKADEWQDAWAVYWRLAALDERNTEYKKLEREAIEHLRLEGMFKEDRNWSEHVERVNWSDAEKALELIDYYYVTEADFREIALSGLEQVLLLSQSTSAREEFKRLNDDFDREEFQLRIKKRMENLQKARAVDRRDAVDALRRALTINDSTIQVPEELFVSEMMRGAFFPLDDFTTIIWPVDASDFDKRTRGSFIGVGISIIKNDATEVEVVTPLDDTPAYRAGIQPRDIITHVNGEEIKKLSLNQVVNTITGPKDTSVTLTIRRNDKSFDVKLVRQLVEIQSVKGYERTSEEGEHWRFLLDDELGIGYVRLVNFDENTARTLYETVENMRAQGLSGLILDLRGNPGGLLTSAYDISSLFLEDKDVVVTTRGRNRRDDQALHAERTGEFADLELAVLVDENSASASEIVSGAIRDNKRGAVIGERTFGKFSVQNLIPLNRTTGSKLKITTARYYLPSGGSLDKTDASGTWGVQPDIPVRLVRWEKYNYYKMRRDRDLLRMSQTLEEASEEGGEDVEDKVSDETGEGDDQEQDAKPGDEQEQSDDDEDKLPPLKQEDVNNRPIADPQLDTALLYMRVKLLGQKHPTIADAERPAPREAKP